MVRYFPGLPGANKVSSQCTIIARDPYPLKRFYNNCHISWIEVLHYMAMDPVCYVDVDEDTARFSSTYRGTDYHFCSDFCRKKFEENPEKYARLATKIDIGTDISC